MTLNKQDENCSIDFEESYVSIASPGADVASFSSEDGSQDSNEQDNNPNPNDNDGEEATSPPRNIPEATPVPASVAPSGITEDYSFAPSTSNSFSSDGNNVSTAQRVNNGGNGSTKNRQVGAGLLTAVVTLPLLGPVLATAAGIAAAYGSTQPGSAGDACRAAGDVALMAKEKAKEVNQKHDIVNKTTSGAKGVLLKVQSVDGRYEILEKLRMVVEGTFRNLGEAFKFAAAKMRKSRTGTDQEDDSEWDVDSRCAYDEVPSASVSITGSKS
jgi:hypothetical protein